MYNDKGEVPLLLPHKSPRFIPEVLYSCLPMCDISFGQSWLYIIITWGHLKIYMYKYNLNYLNRVKMADEHNDLFSIKVKLF